MYMSEQIKDVISWSKAYVLVKCMLICEFAIQSMFLASFKRILILLNTH